MVTGGGSDSTNRLRRQVGLVWRGGSSWHELVRFCLVGTLNTLTDFGVYLLLTRLFDFWSGHILWAALVSWLLAVLVSYLLNNYWTFGRCDLRSSQLGRFVTVAAAGGVWNLLVLGGLVQLGLSDILAKIIATVVVVAWNFTLQKFWTFNTRRSTDLSDQGE